MSTKEAMKFGLEHGESYGTVVSSWGKKLVGVDKITDEMKKEWGADLNKALNTSLIEAIVSGSEVWKKAGSLPSKETIERFAQTAVKASLNNDMYDLLFRLREMAQEPDTFESITAAARVSTTLKRVGQTVAQVFDMVKDRFNQIMSRYFEDQNQLTGRRRWRTSSLKSRHSGLNGEIRSEGESFSYKGDSIYGPRPAGGSPANWSNCSCFLERETIDGDWITL